MPDWPFELLPLAAAWTGYAALHSLLAARRTKVAMLRRFPFAARYYRLGYNLLAVILLIPVLALARANPGPLLWQWSGLAQWLAWALMTLASFGLIVASRDYDLPAFLGLRQLGESSASVDEPPFRIGRLHRYVRHPWYSLALILVWAQTMSAAWLVSCVAITLYLVLGSRLEEARLIVFYGERYRRYRARVPALLPLPGRSLDAAEAAALEHLDP